MIRPVALQNRVAQPCCIGFGRRLLADFRSATAACVTNGLGRTRSAALNIRAHQPPRRLGIGSPDLRARCRPVLHGLHVDHHGRRTGVVEFLSPPLEASRRVGHIDVVALDAMAFRQPSRDLLTMAPHTTIGSDLDPFQGDGSRLTASPPASLRRKRSHSATEFFQIDGGVHA